ncbi:hypothetical protein M9458_038566, partial [Cirrhinus mrigala]
MCVVCLGAEHAASALEGADSPHCELLPLRTLRSRKALFEEGAFTSVPQGACPTAAKAEWKLLPNVSAWDLRTVEKGYSIQFCAPPPPFDGIFPTLVGLEQALVMEQEVETLLRKEAIEVVPPHDRESGFYSRYFIVPKKDGGLRPIIDLHRSVMRLKFKMLTVKQVVSQMRSEDWFVMIDLKDAYFHVSIPPTTRE